MQRSSVAVSSVLLACVSFTPQITPAPRRPDAAPRYDEQGQVVRVALATDATTGQLGGTGVWRIYDGKDQVVARIDSGVTWTAMVSAGYVGAGIAGDADVADSILFIRPVTPESFITWNGKRYRGELILVPAGSGMLIVNRVSVESYLRGVVPLEIGDRPASDSAAIQAQAVAARTYTYTRLNGAPARRYDMVATTTNQVYGGVDAERPVHSAAIEATKDLVLQHNGRVIDTPYHSTCGGTTAAPTDVWKTTGDPYLTPVSDRIEGTDRSYCDISPRFRWVREYDAQAIQAVLDKYLRQYAGGSGPVGTFRALREQGRTPSGRVAALVIETDAGSHVLRGNDIRYVLRSSTGEILSSTKFTVESGSAISQRVVLRGFGFGHGVGMCQWGAIGRARAGQDFRTILATYYPGTTLTRIF
jgi:stage II sporulation protein D